MKKIMILAVAAALIGIAAPNTMAQVPGSSQPSSTPSTQQEEDDLNQTPSSTTTQPGTSGTSGSSGTSGTQSGSQPGTSGSSGSMGTSGTSSSDMEYKNEVSASELPAAITRSVNEKYPGYKLDKAYRGEDGTYKVKVSKGDENQVLFIDERGEVVKSKDSKHKESKDIK